MLIELLKDAIGFSQDNLYKIEFNNNYAPHSWSVAIYGSLIELAQSIHTLLSANEFTGTLPICRTFMENYVELSNITTNNLYAHHLRIEFYQQKLKYSNAAKRGNRYLKLLKRTAETDIPKFRELIAKSKEKFNKTYRINQKFALSNMSDEYEYLYSMLCAASHCNLESIFDRHYALNENGRDFIMFINKSKMPVEYNMYWVFVILKLIDAGKILVGMIDEKLISAYEKKEADLYKKIEIATDNILKN